MNSEPIELVFDVVGRKAILRKEAAKTSRGFFYTLMAALWVLMVYANYELWGLFK